MDEQKKSSPVNDFEKGFNTLAAIAVIGGIVLVLLYVTVEEIRADCRIGYVLAGSAITLAMLSALVGVIRDLGKKL